MLIQQKIGTIDSINSHNRPIDWLLLEWYETHKRILRKRTQSGKELSLKFLKEDPALTQGDLLYEDESTLIAVDIIPCNVIVIKPASLFEMAAVCYEIGNKHLPLFYEAEEVLVPFEQPLFRLLSALGYTVYHDKRKLLHPLKTTVAPHAGHGHTGSTSLFTKIMQLTNPAADAGS
jgi:urease accessory protein